MSKQFLIRLDDASDKMDTDKWQKIERILDEFSVSPIVGVIPDCQDNNMSKYPVDDTFWDKVHRWEEKGWTIAMHGYQHLYDSKCGGINPVNMRSEFAGHSLEVQRDKVKKGIAIMRNHGIEPQIFFAPSHTFDNNTLVALREETNIRTISDTISNSIYKKNGFTFIPQQSGRVRNLPFRVITFCYHPNIMDYNDFNELKLFLSANKSHFASIEDLPEGRNGTLYDKLLQLIYFSKRRLRQCLKG